MRIVLYFINWNDSFYLPFIKEHYGKFCERIVMYDHYSTDDSIKIANEYGFEVRNFGIKNQLNDQHYLDVKNDCWKECRGIGIDYVIVCDADEFIVIPNLKLSEACPECTGYNMISENLPEKSIFEISTGEYSEGYSKQAVFSPDRVKEINFVHGCHKNNKILFNPDPWDKRDGIKLYHLRMIGGVQRIISRHAEYRNRMSAFNNKHQMGFHYHHSDNAKINEWNFLKSKAVKLW